MADSHSRNPYSPFITGRTIRRLEGHAMNAVMEILIFTMAGAFLYFFSDWLLRQIETYRGARFQNRSVIFFVIILVMALIVFNLMQGLGGRLATGSV
jgi:NhaP-type Na+/H+ or K+/H+ antiporter